MLQTEDADNLIHWNAAKLKHMVTKQEEILVIYFRLQVEPSFEAVFGAFNGHKHTQ